MSGRQVSVVLTKELLHDLKDVAVKAALARDVASLKVLHEMDVCLSLVLTSAVRNGFHEVTRALRDLGVKPNRRIVEWAAAKSPEAYFSLCGADGPVFIDQALTTALEARKFSFASRLLEMDGVQVTDAAIKALHQIRPVPRELAARLFAKLPEAPFSPDTFAAAARFGTPAVVDRALRLTPKGSPALLVAIASKWQNEPVVRELLGRNLTIDGSVVLAYMREGYPVSVMIQDQDRVDANFLSNLANYGVRLTLNDVEPLLRDFVPRFGQFWRNFDKGDSGFLKALGEVLESPDGVHAIIDQAARKERPWMTETSHVRGVGEICARFDAYLSLVNAAGLSP